MPRMKRSMVPFLVSALLSLLCGCASQNHRPTAANGQSAPAAPNGSTTAAKRFQDTPLEGRTVVQSAMELSEKYASLSDQTAALRQENQRLTAENEDLKQQMAALDTKLKQTQKELGEANQLLIEMLTELNNWKTNILGFRGEMREAAKAQLEALLKVLEILGGQGEAGAISRQHNATSHPDQASGTPPSAPAPGAKDQNQP